MQLAIEELDATTMLTTGGTQVRYARVKKLINPKKILVAFLKNNKIPGFPYNFIMCCDAA